MRLTTYSDYALRVMMYLAIHSDRRCTIKEISDAYSISKNHLMKLVQDLSHLGLIESTRGRSGGLTLGKPPEEIRLGQVVRQTENDFDLVECFAAKSNQCRISPACHLQAMLAEALNSFLTTLDRYTLADLVTNKAQLQGLLERADP